MKKVKSYKKFSKIMVDIPSKRNYILTNPDIKEKNILKLVRLYDSILDEIEDSYDLIIREKRITKREADSILDNIRNKILHIWED